MPTPLLVQNHSRNFREFQYVYPVFSRRSAGLSIGLNLSPTARCNFACAYCQVLGDLNLPLERVLAEGDRRKEVSPLIGVPQLETELRSLIKMIRDGSFFEGNCENNGGNNGGNNNFASIPSERRAIRDIAFSGDGEPTLSPQFPEVVQRAIAVRRELCEDATKIVLITNGTRLCAAPIREALRTMLENNGEIWAKLDAGTPEHYERVARSAVPYEDVLASLTDGAKELPLVIQSCFLALYGQGPSNEEIRQYTGRLQKILDAGGQIQRVQVYTVARHTPEPWATSLEPDYLNAIAETVRQATGLLVGAYH